MEADEVTMNSYAISVLVTLSSRKELRDIMDGGAGNPMMAGTRAAHAASARLDFLTVCFLLFLSFS